MFIPVAISSTIRLRAVLLAVCLPAIAIDAAGAATPETVEASPSSVLGGSEPPVLVDRWGVEHLWSPELNTLAEGKPRAFAVVFLDVNCPIVTRQAPVLRALYERFYSKQVQFLGIYSNVGLARMDMASHKQKLDLPFPVFLDAGGRLARTLQARATPEAFLLDENLAVKYRGMIDDSGWKKTPGAKSRAYLAEAIEAHLAGKTSLAMTRAQGCELQLAPSAMKPPTKPLTYHDDAAPIIYKRCVSCHYPGGIGPFALDTFESVRDEAATIRREVEYQRMPPWHADTRRGHAIENIQALTADERRTLVQWLDQGLARQKQGEADWLVAGTPPAVPLKLPKIAAEGEFTIGDGRPDFVVSMPKPFLVKASQVVEYQYFWVPNDATEDRYAQAIELLPGNRRVVHHMQAFLIDKRQRPKDVNEPLSGAFMMAKVNGYGGKDCWRIASYTPGDMYAARTYAPDEGVHFPAGYDLVFEMHYSPTDEDMLDRSSVGIVWRKDPPAKVIADQLFVGTRSVEIPPHAPHLTLECLPYFKQNVRLIDIRPHMHLRGGDTEVYAVYPDGRQELLVATPAFDFNWQRRYVFKEPVRLPAGSTLRYVAHWDNTRLNPNNPDPDKLVLFGEESFDEMANLGVTYRIDEEAERHAPRRVESAVPR